MSRIMTWSRVLLALAVIDPDVGRLAAQVPAPTVAEVPPVRRDTPDQRAFREILDNFNAAWATRDADRFVRYFDDDGDFMQAFGRYRRGRADIRAFMAYFFSRQPEPLRHRELATRARLVTPDLAFVEQEMASDNVANADGTSQPPRRGQMMLVLRRGTGGWTIVSYRYLDLHPDAPLRR